jgi:hypothetical protein
MEPFLRTSFESVQAVATKSVRGEKRVLALPVRVALQTLLSL